MADPERIGITILIGIFIYVGGQLLSKSLIDPAYELLKAIGEVRFNLAFHAATIHTPEARSKDAAEKARDALMKSSRDLIAKLHAIPRLGNLWFLFCYLPVRQLRKPQSNCGGFQSTCTSMWTSRSKNQKLLMPFRNVSIGSRYSFVSSHWRISVIRWSLVTDNHNVKE
jgi:hypothetical protein